MLKTLERYDRAFIDETARKYPEVDAVEQEFGHAIDSERLLAAARVLACPVKVNPPNWQHGRVLYAVARDYFERQGGVMAFTALDIGTAKGFSALCVRWAAKDAGVSCRVHSVDVVPPDDRQWRNTVLEVGRDVPLTLQETLASFPDASEIVFRGITGVDWLLLHAGVRVHFAFVDGKHSGDVVRREGGMIAERQEMGDVVIFDDVHIPDVNRAARVAVGNEYERRTVEVISGKRAYLLCRKK